MFSPPRASVVDVLSLPKGIEREGQEGRLVRQPGSLPNGIIHHTLTGICSASVISSSSMILFCSASPSPVLAPV